MTIYQLSSGTIASLIGRADYDTIEAIEQEFDQFVRSSPIDYPNWTVAWEHYKVDIYSPQIRRLIMSNKSKSVEIKVTPVWTSSNVSAVAWDERLHALIVSYRKNRVYAYYDGSKDEVQRVLNADSPNGYMRKQHWFNGEYDRLENVQIQWAKSTEGVRIGIDFNLDSFRTQLGHAMSALADSKHDGKVDRDNLVVILPQNTPEKFLGELRQYMEENLGVDPLYAAVVGDTSMDNLMQVCNLVYTLRYDDPTFEEEPSLVEEASAVADEPQVVVQDKPEPFGFAKFFSGGAAQAPQAEQAPEQLPEPQEHAPHNLKRVRLTGRGKDGRKRVRVPNLGNMEDWILALVYAHASLNKELGGGLFVALPYTAPQELVQALREHGVEIHGGNALPVPGSLDVGVYSED